MSFDHADSNRLSPMPPRRKLARWLFVIVACLFLPTTALFVDETEFAIVERFGRIIAVYDRPDQRGLQFKWPWPVDTVRRFDRRVHLLSPAGREAFTRDRKNITVEAYVVWRVADGETSGLLDRPVVKFFRSLGGIEVAEARLTSRLQSILTERIGRAELTELLNASDSKFPLSNDIGPLTRISADIQQEFTQRADEKESLRNRLGIEIVDVQIRRLNLPTGNMQAVFERMRSERQKIAERYRSAGLAENRMIRSQADRQVGELLAKASAEAERIRGAGDAEAIRILNEAHSRDPEFARVLQTLDGYKQILNERTTLVLSASNSLFKILVDGIPNLPQANPNPLPPAETILPAKKVLNTTNSSIRNPINEQPMSGQGANP